MDTPQRIVLKLKLPRELHFDLTKSLKPRWARKARNPRLPVIIGVSSSDNQKVLMGSEASVGPDSEKAIIGFADDDYFGSLKRKFEQTEEINDPSAREGDHCCKIQKTDSETQSIGRGDHKNIQETESCVVSDQINIDEISLSTDDVHDQAADIKNLQASVKENDADLMAPRRFACSLCSKTFSSHQALGGHKSSHYKFTMKIYDAIDDDLRPPKKQLLISTTTTCHQQIGDERTHYYSCKICFKKFPTGQALGGHQRCHWAGNMKTQSRKILDFDLNELPKEEDEDPSAKC